MAVVLVVAVVVVVVVLALYAVRTGVHARPPQRANAWGRKKRKIGVGLVGLLA